MSDEGPSTNEFGGRQTAIDPARAARSAGAGGLAAMYGLGAARASAELPASLGASARRHRHARVVRGERRGSRPCSRTRRSSPPTTGIKVKTNTVAHGPFQEQINSYLQGRPDDVFTWFAGYRMQFFAAKGLATPIDDVWKALTPQMPPAFKAASTGARRAPVLRAEQELPVGRLLPEEPLEGEGLHGPQDVGPVHRPRQEDAGGRADADRVHRQGRLARDGHLRHPQHAHQRLPVPRRPDGRARRRGTARRRRPSSSSGPSCSPTTPRARSASRGRKARRSSRTSRPACSCSAGSWSATSRRRTQGDIDFFPFPSINSKWGQDSIDAPIDGYMLSKKPKNLDGAKKLVGFFGTAQAINIYNPLNPGNLAVNMHANKSVLQPAAEEGSEADRVAPSTSRSTWTATRGRTSPPR